MQNIVGGPDRLELLIKFGLRQGVTFQHGGTSNIPIKVILNKLSHEDSSGNSFLLEGYFLDNNQNFTGYYNTTSKEGFLEW